MKLHPSITTERVMAAVEDDDNLGFCVSCGWEAMGVEPDAENCRCSACGDLEVYGAEAILLRLPETVTAPPAKPCKALSVPVTIRSAEAKAILKEWQNAGMAAGHYIVLGQLRLPDAAEKRYLMRVGLVSGPKAPKAMKALQKACDITSGEEYRKF